MPNIQRTFQGMPLSDSPFLSVSEAKHVLDEYCDEHNINMDFLSPSDIRRFIEVVRYAPSEISTESIATGTGITVENMVQHFQNRYVATESTLRARGEEAVEAVALSPNDAWYHALSEVAQAEAIPSSPQLDSIDSLQVMPTDRIRLDDFLGSHTQPVRVIRQDQNNGDRPKKMKQRRRSEYDIMMDIVRSCNFPRPNFRDWSSDREIDEIYHDWCNNVEYKEHWIFSRREREGFNRRNIGQFGLDDVLARIGKRKKPHMLDTETSKFYDWKLGGTDWILRLELFQHENTYFLIVRHIYKPLDTEVKFDVRYWSGGKFKELKAVWTGKENKPDLFERTFGSNDESSPYYVRPHEDEDDYEDEDYDREFEEIEWYDGDND